MPQQSNTVFLWVGAFDEGLEAQPGISMVDAGIFPVKLYRGSTDIHECWPGERQEDCRVT